MKKSLLLCLWLFMLGWHNAFAQKESVGDCAQRLKEAEVSFSKGELQRALALIEGCALKADKVYTKEEALQAQTLLATLYEELRSHDDARERMKTLLHDNPRYLPSNEADKMQLINLRNEFTVFPRITAGLESGLTVPGVRAIKSYQIIQGTSNIDSLVNGFNVAPQHRNVTNEYTPIMSYSLFAHFSYALNEHISVTAGVGQQEIRFELQPDQRYYMPYDDGNTTPSVYVWTYFLAKRLTYRAARAGVRYDISSWRKRQVRPFVEAGVQYVALSKAERKFTPLVYSSPAYPMPIDNTEPDPGASEVYTSNNTSVYKQSLWSYYGGGGIDIGHKALSYTIGLRGTYVPGNIVDPNNRTGTRAGTFTFNYLEDDISLRWLSLYAGLNYTFHYAVQHRRPTISTP